MEIRGLQNFQSISALSSTGKSDRGGPAPNSDSSASNLAPVDQLDLSAEAQALSSASGLGATAGPEAASGGIRTEKVAALRRAIAEGNYDTPDRMSAALDRLLEQLG